ncbi:Protein FAR1-RELATED SEQUENCE 5 [Zea mays]|uniref:Protein FAR1-RELATED SEQUENCE 5 n=1 Tax=Zea mays TaxID=4577 RepID=A0A1D6ICW1_MAIZE|nr:Protein FAR1-RELATED SEQUENCE 5 [Zea mays]
MDCSQDPQEESHQRRENGEEAEKTADYGNALSRKEVTEELLGCVVHSEEEAYRLYCDYGHRIGFSVRKGKQSYFIGTKNIRTKDYYCSKEGLKYDEPVTEANFNRPDTRTNCKAMIRFRVDEKGRWTVIRFVPVHNHQLAKPGERHMLRSAKSLAVGKSGVIDPLASTEAHPINGFSDMTGDIVENSGYTIRECYNQVGMQSITGRGSKVWDVVLDTSTMEISCGCRKFERMGLLCSHALKVFTLQNVDTIPEKYVLKRWTKDARRSMYTLAQDDSTQQECTEAELAYRNRAMQYAYNLIIKSQELEESRKIFWDSLETGEKALEVFFEMRNMRTQAAKDADKNVKKKKKTSKGTNPKKAKQAPGVSSTGPELIVHTNEHQFQSSQDAQGNATIGRPYYYQQAFPNAPIQPNQMYMHTNMHTMPLCTPQKSQPLSSELLKQVGAVCICCNTPQFNVWWCQEHLKDIKGLFVLIFREAVILAVAVQAVQPLIHIAVASGLLLISLTGNFRVVNCKVGEGLRAGNSHGRAGLHTVATGARTGPGTAPHLPNGNADDRLTAASDGLATSHCPHMKGNLELCLLGNQHWFGETERNVVSCITWVATPCF